MSERTARPASAGTGPSGSAPGGPPLRALAMLLIALAIVFAGVGAFSLSGSGGGDAASAPSTTAAGTSAASPAAVAAPNPTTAAASTAGATTTSGAATSSGATTTSGAAGPDKSTPIHVFNNSDVQGLAARTAEKLTGAGWNVADTGNYGATSITQTTVYYGNSSAEKAAAEEVASVLGTTAQPRFAGIANSPSGVIVIVTQ